MSIEDALIRRQLFIQRFAGGRSREAQQLLADMLSTVQARLLREPTEFQAGRVSRLLDDVAIITTRDLSELSADVTDTVTAFAADDVAFYERVVQRGASVQLSTPAIGQVEQAVLNTGMDAPIGPKTVTIGEALGQFEKKKASEVQRTINDGILAGRTTPQVAADVGALTSRQRAQVNALTRTVINHASNQAHKSFNRENANILKGEEWVATLDIRTTLICGGRDGRIFPVGRGPYPPAHWSCRSVRVPVVKDEFNIGDLSADRPSKGAEGAEQVTGETRFDGWLRRQPASFQDEYFAQFPDGAEKAALFRRGGLDIQQFRDETGRDYTLEQLRALEPLAFDKANI